MSAASIERQLSQIGRRHRLLRERGLPTRLLGELEQRQRCLERDLQIAVSLPHLHLQQPGES